jgi:hypothetical protein
VERYGVPLARHGRVEHVERGAIESFSADLADHVGRRIRVQNAIRAQRQERIAAGIEQPGEAAVLRGRGNAACKVVLVHGVDANGHVVGERHEDVRDILNRREAFGSGVGGPQHKLGRQRGVGAAAGPGDEHDRRPARGESSGPGHGHFVRYTSTPVHSGPGGAALWRAVRSTYSGTTGSRGISPASVRKASSASSHARAR